MPARADCPIDDELLLDALPLCEFDVAPGAVVESFGVLAEPPGVDPPPGVVVDPPGVVRG